MVDTEIPWPDTLGEDDAAAIVEFWIVRCGLSCTMRASLAKYPGCTHWHINKPGMKGTLEVTMWPAMRALWVSIRVNRAAEWMSGMSEALEMAIVERSTP